jgi:hypothetical protein
MLILFCLFITTAAWADERKDEWKNKIFDFNGIKNIAVLYTIETTGCTDKQESAIDKEKINELVERKLIQAQGLSKLVVSGERLRNNIELAYQLGAAEPLSLKELQADDPAKFASVIQEWTPRVVDAVLKVEIRQFGYTKMFVPAHEEIYTDYETTYITDTKYDSQGNQYTETHKIETPVERTRYVADHYITYAHAGAVFSLFNAKNQLVWQLTDLRDAGDDKVPIEMEERIFDRSLGKLKNVLKR